MTRPPAPLRSCRLGDGRLRHGFFSRHWDDAAIAAFFGVAPENLLRLRQVHSARAVVARGPRRQAEAADGLATDCPGLALAVSTADCVPVLLADGRAGVVGALHAGWRGALAGVCEATVERMGELGADARHVRAVLGPAISQPCYEVDIPFREAFAKAGEEARARPCFAPARRAGHWLFDLAGYARLRLQAAGVQNVETLQHCTYSEADMYFSHRRKGEERGRQVAAIMLEAA